MRHLAISIFVLGALIGCDSQHVDEIATSAQSALIITDEGNAHDFSAIVAPPLGAALDPVAPDQFVNWETPHVHPLDMTPDGDKVVAVNTANNSIEVFKVTEAGLRPLRTIPVGLDPVSVRARNNSEVWVVNQVSDTVSAVNINTSQIIGTMQTEDEPADVIFAGTPQRAYVTGSQSNVVQVFGVRAFDAPVATIAINGEDPRALAVSPDGQTVYAAIFESGNATTILAGGRSSRAPGNIVDAVDGPYGGVNPPPNDGDSFNPPINSALDTPPAVGIIVRKNAQNRWMDDNNGDWTKFVSGSEAPRTGRIVGWDMPDRDVAVIDTSTLEVTYQTGMMNTLMAMSVNPASGNITVVGTEALNEIRYEPNLKGTFLRVNFAQFSEGGENDIVDLNAHLDYSTSTLPQVQRNRAIGDPRGIKWNATGTQAYVTGMGSNNIISINANGQRNGAASTIEVGQGPTGLAIDENLGRIYVLNKFDASISIVDSNTEREINTVTFYDPTPVVIKEGRPHLYSTHDTSGLGHISCASCHIDGRHDRLGWDLGDPTAGNLTIDGIDFHPMKGPMRTQTLQGIIGAFRMHFRGDKVDLLDFVDAFDALQGRDAPFPLANMAQFEDFLATVHSPPNPYRALDNTLPTSVAIPGPGNRVGNPYNETSGIGCGGACHEAESLGRGNTYRLNSGNMAGGQAVVAPSLRNMQELLGLDYSDPSGSNAGFGFIHDGSFDPMTQRTLQNDDNLAFMLTYNGDIENDVHAAVGQQTAISATTPAVNTERLNSFIAMADDTAVGLVAKGLIEEELRGFVYIGDGQFQSDASNEKFSLNDIVDATDADSDMIFTVVSKGTQHRIGVDFDDDGLLDKSGSTADLFTAGWSFSPNEFSGASAAVSDLNGTITATRGGDVRPVSVTAGAATAAEQCHYVEFDGHNDFISLGNPDALNFAGEITLAAWVRPNSSSASIQNILAHTHQTSPSRAAVFLRTWRGNYQIGSWTNTGDHMASAAIPEADIGTDTWVHLAGVYDGETWRLYRNGLQIAETTDEVGAVQVNRDWTIGSFGDGSRQFFDGDVDEPRIFNRGLSSSEVQNLMTQTQACSVIGAQAGPDAGLSNPVATNAITVDGGLSDWADDSIFATDPAEGSVSNPIDWRTLRLAHSPAELYMAYQLEQPVVNTWGYGVYIDVNDNAGFEGFEGEYPIGADFLVEAGDIYRYTGTGNNWSWEYIGAVTYASASKRAELSIPLTLLGNPEKIGLFLRGDNNSIEAAVAEGEPLVDFLPNAANDTGALQINRVLVYSIR